MWRLVLFVCVCSTGCDERKAGRTRALKAGLVEAEAAATPAPLTATALDTSRRLGEVLSRRFAHHVIALGGLTQKLESSYEIRAAGEVEVRLEETLSLRVDGVGQYDLVHRNEYRSREDEAGEDGRSCVRADGRFYTARRHGPATEVPIRAAEDEACLDSALEPFLGLLRRLLPALQISPTGKVRALGREAIKVVFLRRADHAPEPKAIPEAWSGPDSKAVWGPRAPLIEGHAVTQEATGDLVLDAETGVVLSGRLHARFALRKSNRPAVLEVRIGLSAEALVGEIEAPEGARLFAARPRIFVDREALLGKLDRPVEVPLPKPGDAPRLKLGSDEAALDIEDLPSRESEEEDAPP